MTRTRKMRHDPDAADLFELSRLPVMALADDEIIVDSFAGGGGASLGIQWALGRSPDIAINHDKEAIALHAANHPDTEHLAEDVWQVDPVVACRGRKVGLMWLSPDCKHFSKAKGGKPVSKKIRGLAWTAVRWAHAVRPRVIILENVEEFQGWGPVLRTTNKPDPARKGLTFRRFVRRLERLGYDVQWRELRACDYGAPTIRKRLFLIARCDGQAIVWPKPTHGPNRPLPWRTAAECIDWTIPCPSIFERKTPLKPNTLRRIARGIQRYVIDSPKPFIVQFHSPKRDGDDRTADIDAPLNTQSTENHFALATPIIAGVGGRAGQSPERRLDTPYQTITAKGDAALVTPLLVPMQHENRATSVEEPLQTITTQGNKFNVVAPVVVPLTQHDATRGQRPDEPIATVTGAHRGELAVVAPFLKPRYGENPDPSRNGGAGQSPRARAIDEPMPTIVPTGNGADLVAAFMAQHNTDVVGHAMTEPVSTIVGKGCTQALVSSSLVNLRGTDDSQLTGRSIETPLPTISAGGTHAAEVRAFLIAYYGNEKDGGALDEALRTLSTHDRFGLVTVRGAVYQIVDIGMRMLAPRELYNAQGFGRDYRIDIQFNGKPLTKTAQVRMAGNSVCPPVACALAAAQFGVSVAAERAA